MFGCTMAAMAQGTAFRVNILLADGLNLTCGL